MRLQNTIVTFVVIGLIFAWVTTAGAITITHTPTAGSPTILFQDDFEDDTAAVLTTDDANPSPEVSDPGPPHRSGTPAAMRFPSVFRS